MHLYGKHEPRVGRKMGHVTYVGDDIDKLVTRAEENRLGG
ncbi:MAG: hypothetical protein AAF226_05550 [Verrucomicrobiota bacterium]